MTQTPSGLVPLDSNFGAMTGRDAPQLRCILQSDPRAYGSGDVLHDVPGLFDGNGVQVATSPWSVVQPTAPQTFVLVAVPPGVLPTPVFAAPTTNVPSIKSRDYYVWALPALHRVFEVIGDSAMPSRPSETRFDATSGYTSLPLTAQGIASGTMFAELVPGLPANGVSGLALAGASFRSSPDHRSAVRVVGFGLNNPGGETVAPGATYRAQLLGRI